MLSAFAAAIWPSLPSFEGFVRRCCRGCGIAAQVAFAVPFASIACLAEDGSPRPAEPWIVTVGGWAILAPAVEGGRSLSAGARPLVTWRSADSKEWMTLPNDGFDYDLIELASFRAGPVLSWSLARADTLVRRGYRPLSSLDVSIEAGVFAEYWPTEWLRSRIEVRDGVWGGKGWVADLNVDLVWRPWPALTVTGGPRLTLADSRFMETYYGVTGEQARATGLPAYDAGAGLRSLDAGTAIKYDWTSAWSTMAFFEYQRLAGAAGDSPVIDAHGTADQITLGVGASYSFSVHY